MTDTENEAVAKALAGEFKVGKNKSEMMADAAIAALDAHRASQAHVVTHSEDERNFHLRQSTPEPTVSEQTWVRAEELAARYFPGADEETTASALAMCWDMVSEGPTVKPDREAVLDLLNHLPGGVTDEGQEIPLLYQMPSTGREYLADAILALWPGRTERAVAEAALNDAADDPYLDDNAVKRLRDRAKGASE